MRRELIDSITPDYGKDFALIGTINKYAATHNFGDESRNIPQREWLTLADEDMEEIFDDIGEGLTES